MPPVAKNKNAESNTEIENASVDFDALNYQEESINTIDSSDDSEWRSDFSRY